MKKDKRNEQYQFIIFGNKSARLVNQTNSRSEFIQIIINPLTAKLFILNFHPLKVVSH